MQKSLPPPLARSVALRCPQTSWRPRPASFLTLRSRPCGAPHSVIHLVWRFRCIHTITGRVLGHPWGASSGLRWRARAEITFFDGAVAAGSAWMRGSLRTTWEQQAVMRSSLTNDGRPEPMRTTRKPGKTRVQSLTFILTIRLRLGQLSQPRYLPYQVGRVLATNSIGSCMHACST